MNVLLTQKGSIPNPNSLELPKLQMYQFPPFLRGAQGMEILDRHSELLREAREARTAAEVAKAEVAKAAAQDADAESDAIIAGTKAPKPTLDAAIDTANETHRKAYRLIVAANKIGLDAVDAISGEAGAKLIEAEAKREEALRLAALNHLESAESNLAEMVQIRATLAWLREMSDRTGIDRLTGRTLPSINVGRHGRLPDGTDPVASVEALRAAIQSFGGGEEREAA